MHFCFVARNYKYTKYHMKSLIILLILTLIGIGGYFFLYSPEQTASRSGIEEMNTSSSLRAEENMVVVMEQRPGTTVTGMVHLAAPGYLVVHADANGAPGAILGASRLLPAGDSSNVQVTLSRAMKEGETHHAMLHFERGENTTFSAAEDTPVPSALGGPISGWFEVSNDATVDVPISI